MCIRLPCTGRSLRTASIVVGVFTVIQTLTLIVLGGYYIYESLKTGDYGTDRFERLPYLFELKRAYGALYLAFGAVWLLVTLAYGAAIMSERPMYILPWLIFEAISMGLAMANMIGQAVYKDYVSLIVVPMVLVSLVFYSIVFSYYLELQEQKSEYPGKTRVMRY